MSDDRSGQIRDRAYRIWQDEGEPEGRDQEHWAQAERDISEGLDPTAGTDTDATAPLIASASADEPAEAGVKPTD